MTVPVSPFARNTVLTLAIGVCLVVPALAMAQRGPASGQPGAETEAEAQPRFELEVAQVEQAAPPQDDPPPKATPAPAGAGKAADPKQGKQQARDLMQRMFKGLIPKAGSGQPLLRKSELHDLIPADESAGIRDTIDRLAPYVPRSAKILRTAQSEITAGRGDRALELLQRVLDSTEDSLVRTGDGQSLSVRTVANQLLGGLQAEHLNAYQLQHGAAAQRLLDQALDLGDTERMVEAATRYFHTQAGHSAANQLGNIHFDHGEFGMAARWYMQLFDAKAEFVEDPVWRLKVAFALRQTGNSQAIPDLLSGHPHQKPVSIGGETVDYAKWLEQTEFVESLDVGALQEWGMLYGSASRTGVASGSDPLLLRRWSHPLTDYRAIRERIEHSLADMRFLGKPAIPAFFPTAVGGKVVYRTLRGIQVVDVETGKLLWQTREKVSAEALLMGGKQPTKYTTAFRGGVFVAARQVPTSSGAAPGRDPLVSLLLRDAVYGLTSSDGRRLFVVEDHAILSRQQPGYWWSTDPNRNDQYRRDWATNKLVAYDLETGRPTWEVGGSAMGEEFDLPLAGYYFYGVPVVDGDTLYVVGEKGEEVRVISIDAQTGQPEWTQLIAFCDARINRDIGRRWWTAQVAVKDGVVVCPTTVGWMVAVDQMNHALLWAYRYSKPGSSTKTSSSSRNKSLVPYTGLNENWAPAAPIISGNRIIYTPAEARNLVCLNLLDGKPIWQLDKVNNLYLAGVFDGRVLLVGQQSVMAISLEDGKTAWTLAINATKDGRPSGRGAAVDGSYFLPLDSGQLWAISLENGELKERTFLPEGQAPLGNLAMYQGSLLSLSPFGISSYEQKRAVQDRIASREKEHPGDPAALMLKARMLRLKHEDAAALQVLNSINTEKLDEKAREQQRELQIETLTKLISDDPADGQTLVEQLNELAQGARERAAAQRLAMLHHIAAGTLEKAWDVCLLLVDEPGSEIWQDDDRDVTKERWIAQRVETIWESSSDELKALMTQTITKRAAALNKTNVAEQERFLTLFGFHPATAALRLQLAGQYVSQQKYAEAEHHFIWSRNHDLGTAGADAGRQLVDLLLKRKLVGDAAKEASHLTGSRGKETFSDGTRVADYVAQLQQSSFKELEKAQPLRWDCSAIAVRRSGPDHSSSGKMALDISTFDSPALSDFRYELSQSASRLTLFNAWDDSVHWSIPLKAGRTGNQQWSRRPLQSGRRVLLLRNNMLHCLAPLERRLLWSMELKVGNADQTNYQNPQEDGLFHPGADLARHRSVTQDRKMGPIAAVSESFCCVQVRHGFQVIDLRDGTQRWAYREAIPGCTLTASRDYVFLLKGGNQVQVFRADNGQTVEVPQIHQLLAKTVRFHGNSLLLLERTSGFKLFGWNFDKVKLRMFDPFQKETLWTRELGEGISLASLHDGSLMTLNADNQIARLNSSTGELQPFAEIPAEDIHKGDRVRVLRDRDNVYFLLSKSRQHHSFYSEIQTVPVNGTMLAFARSGGKQLWKQQIANQNLIANHFLHTPVLVFATSTYEQKGGIGFSILKFQVIDKRSGSVWINDQATSSGLRSFVINMSDRYAEINTYTMRIRLMASDDATASVP